MKEGGSVCSRFPAGTTSACRVRRQPQAGTRPPCHLMAASTSWALTSTSFNVVFDRTCTEPYACTAYGCTVAFRECIKSVMLWEAISSLPVALLWQPMRDSSPRSSPTTP